MGNLILNSNSEVEDVIKRYPENIQEKLYNLRRLIIESAKETDGINSLEETLKWGEPSFLTKTGSTIRIDWKEKNPEYYAIYFKCTSKLVITFKEVFGDMFRYEGTRAILFKLDETVPEKELKSCIAAALTYHKVKNIPNLGL
ncbi:MAG: hypothetical protein SCALA702_04390 [Melioribacteraceae bacterium]|nr:MAG: hypothetical protein SCALA702_04390 [Melioribacteraceae bacterium]